MTQRTLSDAELARYYRDGFLVVEDFFPGDLLNEINAELDRVLVSPDFLQGKFKSLDGYHPPRNQSRAKSSIMSLAKASQKLGEFCKQPPILDLISRIVYPGIAIYSAKMVNKDPHDATECLWHQDEAYYIQYSKSRSRMSIWLPTDDVNEINGCLRIVPGSHLEGLRPASRKADGHCNLSVDTPIDPARVRLVPMRRGSILLFDTLLLHSSGSNQTDRQRRAFIVSYQEAGPLAGNPEQWEILRPDDYAATRPMPACELVS